MQAMRFEPRRPLGRLQPRPTVDTATRPTPAWTPPVDIREEAERYVIVADVAGVDPGAIDVTMDDGVLSIEGERSSEAPGARASLRTERASGKFARRFTLPETIDADGITATGRNGVLEIAIPKHEKVLARRIHIN